MFDGEGSENRFEEKSQCPKCDRKGIYYTGSSVIHGNPFSPAADTEVEHYHRCPHCKHRWARLT